MIRVRSVRVLDGHQVKLGDGTDKVVDLEPYLRGLIFEPLGKDRVELSKVCVDEELGTIVWPSGADIEVEAQFRRLLEERTAPLLGQ